MPIDLKAITTYRVCIHVDNDENYSKITCYVVHLLNGHLLYESKFTPREYFPS